MTSWTTSQKLGQGVKGYRYVERFSSQAANVQTSMYENATILSGPPGKTKNTRTLTGSRKGSILHKIALLVLLVQSCLLCAAREGSDALAPATHACQYIDDAYLAVAASHSADAGKTVHEIGKQVEENLRSTIDHEKSDLPHAFS